METSMASYKVEVGGNQVPTNSCTACQGQKEKPLALPQTCQQMATGLFRVVQEKIRQTRMSV